MDQISFSLKRAFRLGAEVGFSLMKEFALTPSRYEVLMVLSNDARAWPQSQIRKRIGINRTTVSRFLRALEAAGLVHRYRSDVDARSWMVCLTESGRRCVREVKKFLDEQGIGELVSDTMCFVTPERRDERQRAYLYNNSFRGRRRPPRLPKPLEPTVQSLHRVLRPLELIREALGDTATLQYPPPRRRIRSRGRSCPALVLLAAATLHAHRAHRDAPRTVDRPT